MRRPVPFLWLSGVILVACANTARNNDSLNGRSRSPAVAWPVGGDEAESLGGSATLSGTPTGGNIAVGGDTTLGGDAAFGAEAGAGGSPMSMNGGESANAGAGGDAEPTAHTPWAHVEGSLAPANGFAIAVASEVGTVYAGSDHGGGVFKTTDSGASWRPVNTGLDDLRVYSLAVDPFDARNVLVGTPTGLFRSTDAGALWAKVDTGSGDHQYGWSLTADPVVKGRVYAILNDYAPGPTISVVYGSDDFGVSWHALGTPMGINAHKVDVDASDPAHLFVGAYPLGLLESHDGGGSFHPFANPPPAKSSFQLLYEPTMHVLCANTSDGIARSTNGGAEWQTEKVRAFLLMRGPDRTYYANGDDGVYRSTDCAEWTQVDPHRGYVAVADSSGAVYAATIEAPYQGVRRSPDGLSPFVRVANGMTNADVRGVAVTADGSLFVSANYSGLYRSVDGAASFTSATGDITWVGSTGFPDSMVYVDHTLFAHNRQASRVFRSEDLGEHWTSTFPNFPGGKGGWVTGLLPSPDFANDNTVFISLRTLQVAEMSLQRSLDGGASFTPQGQVDHGYGAVWDKTHAGWLWAMGGTNGDGSVASLYRSQDSGQTWASVPLPVQGNFGALAITATADGEVMHIPVARQGVLRSDDAGASWRLVGNMPVDIITHFIVDPTDTEILYLATRPDAIYMLHDRGVLKSRDGGRTWAHADQGIRGDINALALDPSNHELLYAGTAYGGLFKTSSGGE